MCFRFPLPAPARDGRPAAALPLPLVWPRLSSSVLVLCSKTVSLSQEKTGLSDKKEAAQPREARGEEGARWLVGHGGPWGDTGSQWGGRDVPTATRVLKASVFPETAKQHPRVICHVNSNS